MATVDQIHQAIQRAQAAGNTQDVAALQNALSEATGGASNLGPVTGTRPVQAAPAAAPTGPTRDQLSQAFYAAKQAGNEGDARKIIGYVQQHGMTIVAPSAAQTDAGMQKVNAQNVSDMNDVTLGVPGVNALQFTFHAPSWVARTVAGIGEGAQNFWTGAKQNLIDRPTDAIFGGNRVAQDQAAIAENRRLSQPLNDSTAGAVGNAVGELAESAPLALVPGGAVAGTLGKVGLTVAPKLAALGDAMLAGGGYGYLAPSASTDEHAVNTTLGALAAPVTIGGIQGARAIGHGITNAVRGFTNPTSVAGRTLADLFQRQGLDPAALRATPTIADLQPTVAQVVPDTRLGALERRLRNNPNTGPDFAAQDASNNGARQALLQAHTGSDVVGNTLSGAPMDQLAAAQAQRSANFRNAVGNALDDAPMVNVDNLRTQALELAKRGSNASTRTGMGPMLTFIDNNAVAAHDGSLMMRAQDLHTLQHDMGNLVRGANPAHVDTASAMRELKPFKSAIVDAVDNAVPGYGSALGNYAQDSVNPNTFAAFRDLLDPRRTPSLDTADNPRVSTAALRAFEMKRRPFNLDPQAMADVQAVRESQLAQSRATQNVGAPGSQTTANTLAAIAGKLGNVALRLPLYMAGAGLGHAVGLPFGFEGGIAATAMADALRQAGRSRADVALGELMRNPTLAADAIGAASKGATNRARLTNLLFSQPMGRNILGYGSGVVGNLLSPNPAPPPVATALSAP